MNNFKKDNKSILVDFHFYDDPLCIVGVVPDFSGLGVDSNFFNSHKSENYGD